MDECKPLGLTRHLLTACIVHLSPRSCLSHHKQSREPGDRVRPWKKRVENGEGEEEEDEDKALAECAKISRRLRRALGRGLHSSTSQLNLSRVRHKEIPCIS